MDKKSKKKTDVLRQRVQKLQQQLSGARRQEDEPGEAAKIEAEIKNLLAEIDKLKE